MRFRVEYAAVVVVRALIRIAPSALVRAAGRGIGLLFYLLDGRHRRVTLDNLAKAFPSKTARERRSIARRVFAHFGRLLFDLIKFSTFSHEEMLRRVDFEGQEYVAQAQARGKGYFIFSGHFGFWELHALVHGLRLGRLGMIVRPLDNPYLDSMLLGVREATGNTVIDRSGGIRRVLRELQANHGIAILIDQHIHSQEVVWVDYFGRPAATTTMLAALTLRTGAVPIPVFSLPLPGGRYKIIYERPVPPPKDDSAEEITAFTQRCSDVLEMYVRRYPDVWLWMHRRWREKPEAEQQAAVSMKP